MLWTSSVEYCMYLSLGMSYMLGKFHENKIRENTILILKWNIWYEQSSWEFKCIQIERLINFNLKLNQFLNNFFQNVLFFKLLQLIKTNHDPKEQETFIYQKIKEKLIKPSYFSNN